MFNPDGIVLICKCYITCVNLLFSNSRVQSYIKKEMLLDLRTEVQTVPPDEDVGHVGNASVRRRWVQLARRPVSITTKSRVGLWPWTNCPPDIAGGKSGAI